MQELDQYLLYDELPLWSAPFGLALLDKLTLERGLRILDIGSGSGFPMLEIAERAGQTCNVYGIEPSEESMAIIRRKIALKGIRNAEVHLGVAENLPFEDRFFHRIVSNNGLNNVTNLRKSLAECHRVTHRESQMVLTMNLPGTMMEFYEVFQDILEEAGLDAEIMKMREHIYEKRKSVDYLDEVINKAGFAVRTTNVDEFILKFLDGTAFFNHSFIRTAFLKPWKAIVPERLAGKIFNEIEEELNLIAQDEGLLGMTIPFVCFDCLRI
jgi:arsenite methyltransferase